MRAYEPYPVDLELDGEPAFAGRAGQVFLANMPFFGFGFKIDPYADPSDGLLEAIVLEAPSRVSAATLLMSVYRGHHLDRAGVHVKRGRRARLTGPLPMAADGEPLGIESAAVTVEHGRLRLVTSDRRRGGAVAGVTHASVRRGATRFLAAFGMAALGVGAARAITTSYVPVLLDRIQHDPALIGTVMLVNAGAGFAVPLAVGVWTDRHSGGRLGPRLPFVLAGAALTSVGLTAVALGTESSYLFLALAAAIVYVGLNAAATAHRAIVAESFEDGAAAGRDQRAGDGHAGRGARGRGGGRVPDRRLRPGSCSPPPRCCSRRWRSSR